MREGRGGEAPKGKRKRTDRYTYGRKNREKKGRDISITNKVTGIQQIV